MDETAKRFMNKKRILVIVTVMVLIAVVSTIIPLLSTPTHSSGILSIGIALAQDDTPTRSDYVDNGDGSYTYKNKWIGSYETILFDTFDGDIAIGEYAVDDTGKGFYYRTKPKSESQFEWTDNPDVVKGMKLVHSAAGHAYYDEFLTASGAVNKWSATSAYSDKDYSELPSGSVLRLQSTYSKYWDTARIKDYPQPSRTEVVTVLPPAEPPPILPEHHSIAYDTVSDSGAKSSVSGFTWSHQCTGANGLLVVGVSSQASFGTDRTIDAITYNSDAVTVIRQDTTGGSSYERSCIAYEVSPDTGSSYTVSITFSGTVAYTGGGATSYTGAKQTAQPDNNNGGTGHSTSAATSVTTSDDNSWVVAVVTIQSNTLGNTPDNTLRYEIQTWTSGTGAMADTNAPKHPAGSQTMSWTISSAYDWAISAASFAPAVDFTANISNDPSSKAWGVIETSSTYYAKGSAPSNPIADGECTYTLTNSGDTAKINVKSGNATGGVGWTLTGSAPGENQFRVTTYYSGQNPASGVVLTTSDQQFIASLAASATKKWDMKLETGSSFTDGIQKSWTITLTAVEP